MKTNTEIPNGRQPFNLEKARDEEVKTKQEHAKAQAYDDAFRDWWHKVGYGRWRWKKYESEAYDIASMAWREAKEYRPLTTKYKETDVI